MSELYVENILIRKDDNEEVEEPSFEDSDCDAIYEFKGTIQLKQIIKSVQNAIHNRHDYVFKIISIDEIQKEE